MLCNALVCLAVWLAMGGRSVADKILAIAIPISAFITISLEHSIANWFFLPLGSHWAHPGQIPLSVMAANLVASTLGNLVGGRQRSLAGLPERWKGITTDSIAEESRIEVR